VLDADHFGKSRFQHVRPLYPSARNVAQPLLWVFRRQDAAAPGKSLPAEKAAQAMRLCKGGRFDFHGTDIFLIQPSDFCALYDQGEHHVEGRRRNPREPSHFLNHRYQRVDLHRPSAFEILQHRGLVRADLARALDSSFDVDAELGAQAFRDRLGFRHDRPRQGARGRITADDVALIGLKQTLPHSFNQISSRMRSSTGAFKPAAAKQIGKAAGRRP
jgi:hypothetical protein